MGGIKKNFKYKLEARKLNEDCYELFGKIIVFRDGQIIGAKLRNYSKHNRSVGFNCRRRFYMLAKVILTLFKPQDDACKDFSFMDGNRENLHVDNLMWGSGNIRSVFADQVSIKGILFKHCPSFKGIYVSVGGSIYSLRDSRRAGIKMKQRLLEGLPCIGYKEKEEIHTTLYTHLLVLEAWAGTPYGSTKCIWKDGDRENPALDNLKTTDYSGMILNHYEEGRRDPMKIKYILDAKYGENMRPWVGAPKTYGITEGKIKAIRRSKTTDYHKLAVRFEVSYHQVYNIINNFSYKNVI